MKYAQIATVAGLAALGGCATTAQAPAGMELIHKGKPAVKNCKAA